MKNNTFYELNPQVYDDQFWWKKDDIEFWKTTLNPNTKSVLELAAGTGRLSLPLLREGFKYTGLEISDLYCKYANKKIKKIYNQQTVIQGDMRSFDLKTKYDNIIIPFNSLLHILNEQDLSKTLNCIKKHMHNKSNLYIDIFFPHTNILNRSKNKQEKIMEFYNSVSQKETTINEILDYDSENEIAHIKWFYESEEKTYNTFMFDMKIYYPDTMNRVLTNHGFNISDMWGDYEYSKFNEQSNLQIYKCQLL